MKIKLTKKEEDLLWGDGGPYSEVQIVINMEILDDSVSRLMVEVEGYINPTTFRFVEANKEYFKNDPVILDMLEKAHFDDDESGYHLAIGEPEELTVPNSEVFFRAVKKQQYLKNSILKMHSFVMEKFGIEPSDDANDIDFLEDEEGGIPSQYF
jgi:hypothetical protein